MNWKICFRRIYGKIPFAFDKLPMCQLSIFILHLIAINSVSETDPTSHGNLVQFQWYTHYMKADKYQNCAKYDADVGAVNLWYSCNYKNTMTVLISKFEHYPHIKRATHHHKYKSQP